MTYIIKKISSASICFTLLISFFLTVNSGNNIYAQEIEETADTVLASDDIITGKMKEFSENGIVVDRIRYSFCKGVNIFTPRGRLIPLKDIGAAEEVKLFRNNGCVRKVKVIRFAQ